MGVARLLAKGWVLFCVFAGAHAVYHAAMTGVPLAVTVPGVVVSLLLFAAMGLLFVGGYGVSARDGAMPLLARLKPHHLLPDFNGIVFLVFVVLSFGNQVLFAPYRVVGPGVGAIQSAIQFVIPGQDALLIQMGRCSLDGGRAFSSAFAWILAIIFAASALSRAQLSAGLMRIERTRRPEPLGPTVHAAVLGIAALAGIQLLLIGSVYPWLDCGLLHGLPGAVLIGIGPLMLAYLIVAAVTATMAVGPQE